MTPSPTSACASIVSTTRSSSDSHSGAWQVTTRDAGELLTLQRAAYATEARIDRDSGGDAQSRGCGAGESPESAHLAELASVLS
jgi:hypothetical protein